MKPVNNMTWVLLLIISIASCQSDNNLKSNNQDSMDKVSVVNFSLSAEQLKSLKIEFTSPEKVNIQAEKTLNGIVNIDPKSAMEIHVPYAGYLKKMTVLDGQSVSSGQTIGVIENPYFLEVQRDYLQSRIELKKTQSEYERFQKLWSSKSISEKEWIDAQSSFEMIQLKHQSLKQLLISFNINPDKLQSGNLSSQVPLVSPISGIITESNVNNGKFYQPEERIAKVINFSSAFLELTAFERDKNDIQLGNGLIATEIDHPEQKLMAKVTQIDPTINSDGSFKVIAQLLTSNNNLKKGMHIQAKISGTQETVFSLAKSSLVGNPDQPQLIKRVAENEFSLIPIVLIKEDSDRIYFQFKGNKLSKNEVQPSENKFVSSGAYDIYMEMLKE
jgi:cobalt-zinc-cadmium efflux system membrane fusion protein